MRSHLDTKWSNENVPPCPTDGSSANDMAAACASSLPGVQNAMKAGTPSIVFFFVEDPNDPRTARQQPADKDPKAKKEARKPLPNEHACDAVRSAIFEGDDYRILTALRFFQCVWVNVTNVTPDKNRVFCANNAPMILVLDKEGKAAGTFAGQIQCKPDPVYQVMCSVLIKDGNRGVSTAFAAAAAALKGMFEAEVDVYRAKSDITSAQKNLASAKGATGKANAEAQIAKGKDKLKQAEQARYQAMKAEYDALKSLGMPKGMPSEPKAPAG